MSQLPKTPSELEKWIKDNAVISDHKVRHVADPLYSGIQEQVGFQGIPSFKAADRPLPELRDTWNNQIKPVAKVFMRLGWLERPKMDRYDTGNGIRILDAVELQSRYAVVVVKGDEIITLYDDFPMFPSDALVAKIRLLEE